MMMTARQLRAGSVIVALAGLVLGCASTSAPKPSPLSPEPAISTAAWAWQVPMGLSSGVLRMQVVGQTVVAASDNGEVLAIDAPSGRVLWRVSLDQALSAGVGSDGLRSAVVTQSNELVTVESAEVRWRARLPARVLTPPLVAGGRVFVALADRSIMAFDGSTGARLWTQVRAGDPLVLRQSGVLLAVGDTLVVGGLGRLQGLNPNTGRVVWDAALATPRGTNEVERLVDTVGPVSRVGNSVCARAFSASVGCVDASNGRVVWTRPSTGAVGLGGDAQHVVGADSDGRLVAWRRDTGEPLWSLERLKFRGLTAPVVLKGHVAVGDEQGVVHWLDLVSSVDKARWRADGSPIVGAPVTVADSVVVQTHRGGVYAWRAP